MSKTSTNGSPTLNSRLGTESFVNKNLEKLKAFRSWILWYPDLFLDLIKPATGGLNLHFDQRIAMRCDARFFSYYGCFPRGSSKTLNQILVTIILCIALPGIEIALTAQTKENAVEILKDKFNEATRWYPALQNEVKKVRFSKSEAEITFNNEARLDVLSNSGNSKGMRRRRLRMEEAALLDAEVFEDSLLPIVEVGRYTCGPLAIMDPCELNGQICFFTTTGWRGSDEHRRLLKMYRNMIELNGNLVLGSNWMLSCWNGRGSSKAQILEKKRTMSPIAFAQNYEEEWTGASSGALVNMNKLLKCRNLSAPLFEAGKTDEIIMAVDVARSQSDANNKSSIAVVRVRRNDRGRISSLELCNLFNISNTLNYTNQALIVKRTKEKYNAKIVVVDGNGVGVGLVDELLKETVDPATGEIYRCWNTINTTNEPEYPYDCDECLFDMKAQSYQNKVITDFIDVVDSGVLRLLEQKQYDVFTAERDVDYQDKFMPFIQTDLFVEEVSNLKLESNGKNLIVRQEVKRVNKDRFSAVAYAIFYALEFENSNTDNGDVDWSELFKLRVPKLRT